MSDWYESTLGQVCDEVNGLIQTGPFGSQLHQSDYTEHGVPVVMPKDIVGGRISSESVARVSVDHVDRLSRHKLSSGDIIYGRRGDIGRQALIRSDQAGWMCGTGCLRISLGESTLDPLFLHYYLSQDEVISWIANQAVGATMPNLNTAILRSVPVKYPVLSIQRRIAGILSAYDDLIENSQRRIKILEEMARRLYREWFVYFRFPGYEVCRFVDSPLGEIPEGWNVVKIGDIAEVLRGRSYRSVDLSDEAGLPFLNLKCLDRDGGFRRSGLKRFIGDYRESHIARKGDIIMAVTDMTQERRIVARAALVPTLEGDTGVISMDLVRVDPSSGLSKLFLYSLFRYSSFADEVKHHANGANVLHLSPERVTGYELALPADDLMESYVRFAGPIYEEIDVLENRLDNLRRTRDLLLPRLLSGQIDVEALAEPVLPKS